MPSGFIARGLFLCKNLTMDSYIYSLILLGFSPERATEKCIEIVNDYGLDVLGSYISGLEADLYVD